MPGLSTTLYDTASIDIIDGHSAAAKSGSDGTGRALSDIGHSTGLWYAEVELSATRSTTPRYWGISALSNTGSLNVGLGADSDAAYYAGFFGTPIARYLNAGFGQTFGTINPHTPGQRFRVWVNAATRKMWMSARPFVGGTWSGNLIDRPSSGSGETWTVPGTGPIHIALRPANGSGSDRNVLRFRSRYSEIDVSPIELDGALPWDARTATIVEDVSGVENGTTLRWAWFDQSRPDLLTVAPTSTGTATVTSGQVSVSVNTSLDAGGIGSLLLSNTDGTVVQCRSHYAPAAAP